MELNLFANYFSRIKGSVGAKTWQHLYAGKTDLTKSGKLSCALFASSILHHCSLIQSPHATVQGTERDMVKSGWKKISKIQPGCVILWEPKATHDGPTPHPHIGFGITQSQAISNSSKKRVPIRHNLHFGQQKRKISAIYWHSDLDKKPKN